MNRGGQQHWLTITLRGRKSNRDGLGARVRVNGQTRFATMAGSYLSSNDKRLHSGLGSATTASVEVAWPSGLHQKMDSVPAEAIAHLERAHAVEALGIAQIETGQYQQAIANLNAALAEHPNQPDLLYYLGRAAGLLSKRSIDTLIAAYPDSARTHQAMAENYYVLRQMP